METRARLYRLPPYLSIEDPSIGVNREAMKLPPSRKCLPEYGPAGASPSQRIRCQARLGRPYNPRQESGRSATSPSEAAPSMASSLSRSRGKIPFNGRALEA
ncbi:MAG: hypothetical protein BECKG1743F_GA0114225_103453 [Candidatus Kentron sp. G]|nr:MAG: hypothetical protein BECKG1743F_GA0114225_103453 [Candidatus Kentron sp. G]